MPAGKICRYVITLNALLGMLLSHDISLTNGLSGLVAIAANSARGLRRGQYWASLLHNTKGGGFDFFCGFIFGDCNTIMSCCTSLVGLRAMASIDWSSSDLSVSLKKNCFWVSPYVLACFYLRSSLSTAQFAFLGKTWPLNIVFPNFTGHCFVRWRMRTVKVHWQKILWRQASADIK